MQLACTLKFSPHYVHLQPDLVYVRITSWRRSYTMRCAAVL